MKAMIEIDKNCIQLEEGFKEMELKVGKVAYLKLSPGEYFIERTDYEVKPKLTILDGDK